MYKDVLRAIDGIEIYPVISFIIFFSFFIVLGIYVFSIDKGLVNEIKNLPIQEANHKQHFNSQNDEK